VLLVDSITSVHMSQSWRSSFWSVRVVAKFIYQVHREDKPFAGECGLPSTIRYIFKCRKYPLPTIVWTFFTYCPNKKLPHKCAFTCVASSCFHLCGKQLLSPFCT